MEQGVRLRELAARDVPSDHVNPVFVPKDGVEYRELSRKSYGRLKEVVADYVRSALPR